MKKLVLALLLVFVGCSGSAKRVGSDAQLAVALPVAASKPPLTDAEKISLLRDAAHKRGLRWIVRCSYKGVTSGKFFGMASLKSAPVGALYVEEGAKPAWIVFGDSEIAAVENLYLSIQGDPNVQPEHREVEKPEQKCRELRGE